MIENVGSYDKNFKNGTISFGAYLIDKVNNEGVTHLRVINLDTKEVYSDLVDAKLALKHKFKPFSESDYFISPYINMKEVYTQKDLSVRWGINPCRLAELHRFEYLIPHSKIGRTFQYNPSSVASIEADRDVKIWLHNTRKSKRAK